MRGLQQDGATVARKAPPSHVQLTKSFACNAWIASRGTEGARWAQLQLEASSLPSTRVLWSRAPQRSMYRGDRLNSAEDSTETLPATHQPRPSPVLLTQWRPAAQGVTSEANH